MQGDDSILIPGLVIPKFHENGAAVDPVIKARWKVCGTRMSRRRAARCPSRKWPDADREARRTGAPPIDGRHGYQKAMRSTSSRVDEVPGALGFERRRRVPPLGGLRRTPGATANFNDRSPR